MKLCRRAVKIINLKTVSRKIPQGLQNKNKNFIKIYNLFENNSSSGNRTATKNNNQRFYKVTGIPTRSNDSRF